MTFEEEFPVQLAEYPGMRFRSAEHAASFIEAKRVEQAAIAYFAQEDLSALTEVQRAALNIARAAFRSAHQDSIAYAYGAANVACCIRAEYGLLDYDYGSPYTSHKSCKCAVCLSVRAHNGR
jgi:hypothetical protein